MGRVKQVIVMRRDLKMRRGKEIAQGAHASMAFVSHRIRHCAEHCLSSWGDMDIWGVLKLTRQMMFWFMNSFAKICVRVNSEEELLDVYKRAKEAGLEVHLITDSGKTEFKGVPTNTCLAIGPDDEQAIDKVTGELELY